MASLASRYALVTGANRGLGLEWTRQLAPTVDRLFATCRRPEEAETLRDVAAEYPETVDVFALDVSDPDAIDRAAAQVERDAGHLDLLVNNAGINGGGTGDGFGSVDQEAMMEVFRVNSVGPHLVVQTFADLLRAGADAEGQAIVVNVTSQLGSIANTSGGGWHSYKASKAALNMCTRLQTGALKSDGVIPVSMHPGWVRTDMGGSNARLSTEDSVRGMIDVLDDLTPEDAGRFLTFDGDELPW
jgi:NAD(P)-dependent dehydrogenase (short-subunit alcohol dehydrogenase family)